MQENTRLIVAVFLIWQVVAIVCFLRVGRRIGTLVTVVGGTLLLPSTGFPISNVFRIGITQTNAIGLALGFGMIAVERTKLFPFRLRWVDLPIILFTFYPLVEIPIAGSVVAWDATDMALQRLLGWLLPYAAARRYLGNTEGAKQIGVAIVVSTLAYVPVCLFESAMGPKWYLGGLIYGVTYKETMVSRLGGWRPEGFFFNGLTLASWMAMAAVVAVWLWLGGLWRPRRGPAWWPALVLVAASIACRGVYGYLALGLGLALALISLRFRTRVVLIMPFLVAPCYLGLRVSGIWNARGLSKIANLVGRGGTVEFRLNAEDWIVNRVVSQRPMFGFGNYIWNYKQIGETISFWPDGAWLFSLWSGGLVGLGLLLLATELFPAALIVLRTQGPRFLDSPLWMLVVLVGLNAIDGLHNNAMFTPIALAVGSLVGVSLGIAKSNRATFTRDRPRSADRSASEIAWNGLRFATVLMVLAIPEFLGFLGMNKPSTSSSIPTEISPDVKTKDHDPSHLSDDELRRKLKAWSESNKSR